MTSASIMRRFAALLFALVLPGLLAGGEAYGFIFYMCDDLTVYTLMISGIPMDVNIMREQLMLPRPEILSRTDSLSIAASIVAR